jgi:flap endonuclease-1
MGVTNLGKLINNRQEVDFDFFNNKALALDGNNILYQFLTRIRQSDGRLLTDTEGNVTSHLTGLLYRTTKMIESGIQIVFIFDGEPPKAKTTEINERKQKKKVAKASYEKALEEGDMKAAKKYAQRTTRLTGDMITDAKHLLKLLGIPVIQAPSEGEAQAAIMTKRNDVWASCSQDYDSLLFGTPRLVRNLTVSGKRKLPGKNVYVDISPELISLKKNLEELELSRDHLIEIAILLGTDFNPEGISIKGVGPKTALKLIKKHHTVENVLSLPKMKDAELERPASAIRDIFMNPKVTTDYSLTWPEPNIEGIVSFLVEERDFSEARVRNALEKTLKKIEEEKKQPSLDSFFKTNE